MNKRQAELVLAILEAGSISGAAEKLYVTQPALSQALKTLEKELKTSIFQRGTNPIRLTYAGEKVADTARKIILLEQNLKREIEDINEERSGLFRFGLYSGATSRLLTTLVPLYVQVYPHVKLNIIEMGSATIEQMLLDGSLDAGILRTLSINKDLEYKLISEDRIVLIAPKNSSFAKIHPDDRSVNFNELQDYTFITKRKGNYTRHVLDQFSEMYQIKPRILFEIDDFSAASRIAHSCDCLMIAPLSSYYEDSFLPETALYYHLNHFDDRNNTYLCYPQKIHFTSYMKYWLEMVEGFYCFQSRKDIWHEK